MSNASGIRFLPQLFSRPAVVRYASSGGEEFVRRLVRVADVAWPMKSARTMAEVLDLAYQALVDSYRSEYVYKNAIANKILLARHSLRSTMLLTEFRAGTSKADIVLLNGTSTVYEIKSEYDSIERVQSQVMSYSDLFDRVFVCCHASQLARLDGSLPEFVGIVELTKQYSFRTVRDALSNKANVNPGMIFHSLRRDEYTSIVQKHFGSVPVVANADLYQACHAQFARLHPEMAHDAMVEAVRRRIRSDVMRPFLATIPHSLKAACLYTPLSSSGRAALQAFLSRRPRLT